jgi:hypothetical protein
LSGVFRSLLEQVSISQTDSGLPEHAPAHARRYASPMPCYTITSMWNPLALSASVRARLLLAAMLSTLLWIAVIWAMRA